MLKSTRSAKVRLVLLDATGKQLYAGPPEALPLPDTMIAALSDTYFGDPDPCFIHQGAVRARVGMEIELDMTLNHPYSLESLPERTRAYCHACGAASALLAGEARP